jgi:hypothetical protein
MLPQKWFYRRFATQLLPIIDNQSQVNFVQNKAIEVYTTFPIGALTKGSEGKDMAELFMKLWSDCLWRL